MRRAILKVGDRSTNGGVVTEGISNCTHHGTPITFIGARVWCNGCKSEGVIGWKGPHQKAAMMGKQQALDGDICICKCTPPPVMLATQDSAWQSFTPEEWAAMGGDTPGTSTSSKDHGAYDERVRILDATNRPLSSVPYHIRAAGGGVYKGLTDASGYCDRVHTDDVSRLDISVGMQALERWDATR
ncbi:PAAR domain-containing protein [Paraburkholderia sp. DHOC27]|uniref:PAAR domain-containing protein n=1 Tax=Paraburkholderia sp. DHOC27 TaxID=2303330 RepID=UPI000E3C56B7|nr:PAAR domain-containing protein [Paraburkholderia sp. DHOC27]RFU45340.1 PAAR domain-containing protein [Paraburkholderia sp. DHOC27]